MRAFLNGRLDLAQAESVAQLVAAKTSVAAQSALAGIQVMNFDCLTALNRGLPFAWHFLFTLDFIGGK